MNFRKLLTSAGFAAWPARAAVLFFVVPPTLVFLLQALKGFGSSANPSGLEVFSWALLARSLGLGALTALLSALIGGVCGTIAGRLSRISCATVLFFFILPLAMPPAVHAYVWRNLALSAGLLGGLFVEGGSSLVNFAGAVASMVSAFWAIPALAAFAVSAGPGRRYELEARPFAPPSVAVRKILVPSVIPALAASAGLVFILAFGEYAAVALWQINTFPVHVLSLYTSMYEPHLAAAASLVPALITGVVAAGVFLVASRALTAAAVERAHADPGILWRPSLALRILLAGVILCLVGVPVGACGGLASTNWTGVASLGAIFGDLGFTILIASAAAALAAAAGVLAACAHWAKFPRWRLAIAVLALAAFLLPSGGAGLAIKAVSSWRAVPAAFGDTAAALVYAFAGRFMAIPLLLAFIALSRVDAQYRYLAQVSGASGLREIISVSAPIVSPAALAGFAVAAVLGTAEIPIAMLVAPPGHPPVSVDLFNLMHYARQSEAFAVALAMSAGSAVAVMATIVMAGRLSKRFTAPV